MKCSKDAFWKCLRQYISKTIICINHFIFIHIITNFRRKRNDGNVMGTADYVRKENLFTGTETFKGQGKRGPD